MPGLEKVEYAFRGQLANEDVLIVTRASAWIIFVPFFLSFLILIADVLLVSKWGVTRVTAIPILISFVFIFMHLGSKFYLWKNGIYILTNQRILVILQKAIFKRSISEAPLENIQTVKSEVSGISGTVFGYGLVKVKTAAGENDIILNNVSDPYNIEQKILLAKKRRG